MLLTVIKRVMKQIFEFVILSIFVCVTDSFLFKPIVYSEKYDYPFVLGGVYDRCFVSSCTLSDPYQ